MDMDSLTTEDQREASYRSWTFCFWFNFAAMLLGGLMGNIIVIIGCCFMATVCLTLRHTSKIHYTVTSKASLEWMREAFDNLGEDYKDKQNRRVCRYLARANTTNPVPYYTWTARAYLASRNNFDYRNLRGKNLSQLVDIMQECR